MKNVFYLFALAMLFILPYSVKAQYVPCAINSPASATFPYNYLNGCSAYSDFPDSFTTRGGKTNIHYATGTCPSAASTGGYDYETGAIGDTVTGLLGDTIHFRVYNDSCTNTSSSTTSETYALYVDFNHNGSYNDPGEFVWSSLIAPRHSDSGYFVIPTNAVSGHSLIRLFCVNDVSASSIDPCNLNQLNGFANGLAIDYDMVIKACSGTPLPDTILTAALTSTICFGTSLTLNAQDRDTLPGITFQWQQASSPTGPWTAATSGTGMDTLTYSTGPIYTSTYYRLQNTCIEGNGTDTSAVYAVTINNSSITIISQPINSITCPGGNGSFNVSATAGSTQITYNWQVNTGNGFQNISNTGVYSGDSTSILHITGATIGMNGYAYRCVMSGYCLIPAVTITDTLKVVPTVISAQPPATANTCTGGITSFGLTATGYNLFYQWQVDTGVTGYHNMSNNTVYSGVNSNQLNIGNAPANLNGYHYKCIVTGFCGTLISSAVAMSISPPTLTAFATGPTTLCPGYSVTLKANISGTPISYQWSLNGVAINNATDSFYTATVAGAYTATLTNSQNCVITSSQIPVFYYSALPSAISVSGPLTFCQGGSVTLSATTLTSGVTYLWKLNGNYISSANSTTYTASVTGNYTLIEYDGNCYTPSTSVAVNSVAPPSATITYTGLPYICSGDTLVLNAPTGTGLSYQWQYNNININGGNTSSLPVSSSGSYTVQVTNSTGCSTTSSPLSITVNPLPQANITSSGSASVCQGAHVVLNASAGNNLTYQWQRNNVNISGATNSSYIADSSGFYTVIVTGNSTNGCSATSTAFTVTIHPSPSSYISHTTPTTFCMGGNVLLSTNPDPGVSHQWFNNLVGIQGATGLSYTATTSGSYTVMNTQDGCSALSPATNVVVNPLPADSIVLYGAPVVCSNNPLLLEASLVGVNLSYQWYVNGIAIQGANGYQYPTTLAGQYSVAITDANNCTGYSLPPLNVTVGTTPNPVINFGITSAGATLSVNGNYVTFQWYEGTNIIPGADSSTFTPSHTGGYAVLVTDVSGCTGMSQIFPVYSLTKVPNVSNDDNIRIYPNPASSIINIEASVNVNIRISGVDGKIVLQQENAKTVDISQLATGIYMIQVSNDKGLVLKNEKLVKKNW